MPPLDLDSFFAGLLAWAGARAVPVETVRYGAGPEQELDLRLPGADGRDAAVVLLHGGFWRERYRRDLMDALAVDLARRGFASCNVEYRRVGNGGGVPATLDDVAAAIACAGGLLPGSPLLLVGHSAGGHLALWGSAAPGVAAAVSLAGVCDLTGAARERLGDGAAIAFAGGTPEERPEAYAAADPLRRLPAAVPTLLVHGAEDDVVPPGQSRRYAAAAGELCELLALEGVGHFEPIDPRTDAWRIVAERLERL